MNSNMHKENALLRALCACGMPPGHLAWAPIPRHAEQGLHAHSAVSAAALPPQARSQRRAPDEPAKPPPRTGEGSSGSSARAPPHFPLTGPLCGRHPAPQSGSPHGSEMPGTMATALGNRRARSAEPPSRTKEGSSGSSTRAPPHRRPTGPHLGGRSARFTHRTTRPQPRTKETFGQQSDVQARTAPQHASPAKSVVKSRRRSPLRRVSQSGERRALSKPSRHVKPEKAQVAVQPRRRRTSSGPRSVAAIRRPIRVPTWVQEAPGPHTARPDHRLEQKERSGGSPRCKRSARRSMPHQQSRS